MSIVKARRCTTASTRLAVAEKTKERERKTSGILGAYAAGLMILILILSFVCTLPKNRSPGRWVQCPWE